MIQSHYDEMKPVTSFEYEHIDVQKKKITKQLSLYLFSL